MSAGWKRTVYDTVNNFDGVTMSVMNGKVSARGLTVVLQNRSQKSCMGGQWYVLEKKINGEWFEVPVAIKGNSAFTSIGYEIASGEDREWEIEWEWLYRSLDPGIYRIVKDVLDFRGTGDFDKYYLTAEFTIEQTANP